ncbi:heat-inducible transcriptional repressor HrcA [Alicyclobacillus acidocaldarius]|uniref:Heat-inducible transcription repressor HrcA n=1 Tax=Alicyclobacillus acidocaldarius subsp. acidocaldarius (strain ATCC 27009 / DSM 446 / BCRC 14685 / JCM 5260 / KCTC 1825 / NBRC 15652 / NCIMB 11725 / NRRL B-14509 / 104-IA) TaxID=521098 RepID=C8WY48_ALIAD|nr:heat-inducible transcriptional repressor HrcA [Alicyclobacillus acidocaldarius]ACV59010.1 heat-inducible transcription repressor HrcA [Alicyclobacillus acidocaldarius subsp. acidocaldarius DSM 446]
MLTPRQQLILSAIIEDYVRMAEPIGSRALAKHEEIQYSPATIRNEMADLEEMGYLTQPHASAGRFPSQKGYRFYVDNLLRLGQMDRETGEFLKSVFTKRIDEVEQVAREVANVLSMLTKQTVIVLGPKTDTEKLRKIELIPLGGGRAIAILVTNSGHVETVHVRFSSEMEADDVETLVRVLNDKVVGVPISELRRTLYAELAGELRRTVERFEDAIAVLNEVCQVPEREEAVYIGGASNMLAQPEFHDVGKAQPILSLLEQNESISNWFPKAEDGIEVRIGAENAVVELKDCTVIATTYRLGGVPVGHIGVLGPTRMDYNRVMQILSFTSQALTEFLTRFASSG